MNLSPDQYKWFKLKITKRLNKNNEGLRDPISNANRLNYG